MLRPVEPSDANPQPLEQPVEVAADLNQIEQDLADVETALARLEAGTYWTCEVTGADIPDSVLAVSPTARRAAGGPALS
jgi:RNA polymerase-binding transcription factor DksA